MGMIDVTLMGATIRRREAFADDVPIEHLLPSMIGLAGDSSYRAGRWTLGLRDGTVVDPSRTLAELGLEPDEPLLLARRVHAIDPEVPLTAEPTTGTPLPVRLGPLGRLGAAGSALLGFNVPLAAERLGVFERARVAWRWSRHEARLDWLIGSHRLRRTVVVAVASTAPGRGTVRSPSAEWAWRLARRLSEARRDRIALIDGDLDAARLTRRLRRVDTTVDELWTRDRWETHDLDARFAGSRVSDGNLMTIGQDRNGDPVTTTMLRGALDRLRPHSGVIVMDVGSLADCDDRWRLADQIVLAVDGSPEQQTALPPEEVRPCVVVDAGSALTPVGLDRIAPHATLITGADSGDVERRLAIALVDGWMETGALVEDPAEVIWDS